MAREPKLMVGVCTLNEAENIEAVLSGIRASLPTADILVIDDDSSDGTIQRASAMAAADPAIKLRVRHDERGLGSAIRTAMLAAVEGDYDYFINLDADLSHDPTQLPRLRDLAVSDPDLAVVIGSRYAPGGGIEGWPLRRRWMSRLVNRFATTCLRLPVRDCSGSMRCYRVDALRQLDPESLLSDGYSILEEVLLKLHRQGAKMAEVAIVFTDRTQGQSKLTFREAIRSSTRILGMAFRR